MTKTRAPFFLLPLLLLLLAAGGTAWGWTTTSIDTIPVDVYQTEAFDVVGSVALADEDPIPNVRIKIIVSGPIALDAYEDTSGDGTAADNVFEIIDVNNTGDTQGVNNTFTLVNGDFVGYWGPDTGFSAFDATTTFTIEMNNTFPAPIGTYEFTLQVVEWDAGSGEGDVLSEDTGYTNLHLFENTFANIVAFGDSLTDRGNAAFLSDGGLPESWTNGADSVTLNLDHVWVEYLRSAVLPFGWSANLYNYAVGGAMTQYNTNASIVQYGLDKQVADYLADFDPYNGIQPLPDPPPAPADTLYTIWIGANDMFAYLYNPDGDPTDEINTAITNIFTQLNALATAGATNFLVLNLPDLGGTPAMIAQGEAAQAGATALTMAFNMALTQMLEAFEVNPGVNVHTADAFTVMQIWKDIDVFDNETGMYSIDGGDPKDYLFWDGIHPTTHAHVVMASVLARLFPAAYIDKDEDGVHDLIDDPTYDTIQDAIDAAAAGETIIVPPGTPVAGAGAFGYKFHNYYTEGEPAPSGLIKVTRGVTIKAGAGDRPVIDGTGADGVFKIHPSALEPGNTVIIEGFEITGDPTTGIAMTMQGCFNVTPAKVIIRDNWFHGMIGGIDFWGATSFLPTGWTSGVINTEITGNKFYDMVAAGGYQGAGIVIESPLDWATCGNDYAVKIEDNEFSNLASDGTNYGTGIGILDMGGTDIDANVFISGNTFNSDVPVGVAFTNVDVVTTKVANNNFDNNPIFALYANGNIYNPPIDAENNWWGAAGGPNGAFNPNGTPTTDGGGAAIGDYVDAEPWLMAEYIGGTDTIGVYDPTTTRFYLRNTNSAGVADVWFPLGGSGWIPLSGDWNGDGTDTIGIYDPATSRFYLKNSNSVGTADIWFPYGAPGAGWIPLAGDWDGDGIDTIGIYDPATSRFYLRNSNSAGFADIWFPYGAPGAGWIPLAGDWDGDGVDTIGVYDPATTRFYLRNSNSRGVADVWFPYGGSGWTPLAGDWDGDGVDTIGTYDPTTTRFYLRNSNSRGNADIWFPYGGLGWTPLAGDWDNN